MATDRENRLELIKALLHKEQHAETQEERDDATRRLDKLTRNPIGREVTRWGKHSG
jgi:hypothetical protein